MRKSLESLEQKYIGFINKVRGLFWAPNFIFCRNIKINNNARKDLPELKGANLNDKFDELITVIRGNPYQNPPPYES